jgi:hypothetical protein
MCRYIPTLYLSCACTTFNLPIPNPCHWAKKNSTPCPHRPSDRVLLSPSTPGSPTPTILSPPSLSLSVSTISEDEVEVGVEDRVRGINQDLHALEIISPHESDLEGFNPNPVVPEEMTVLLPFRPSVGGALRGCGTRVVCGYCPFHAEDREEREFERSGKEKVCLFTDF